MAFRELVATNRRRVILELLNGDPGHVAESRLVRTAIAHLNRTHDVDLAQIRDDLRWLESRLLVRLEIDEDRIYAGILQRGSDVAEGRTQVSGIDASPLD